MSNDPYANGSDPYKNARREANLVAKYNREWTKADSYAGEVSGPVLEITWEWPGFNNTKKPWVPPGRGSHYQVGPMQHFKGRIFFARFTTLPFETLPPADWCDRIVNLDEALGLSSQGVDQSSRSSRTTGGSGCFNVTYFSFASQQQTGQTGGTGGTGYTG